MKEYSDYTEFWNILIIQSSGIFWLYRVLEYSDYTEFWNILIIQSSGIFWLYRVLEYSELCRVLEYSDYAEFPQTGKIWMKFQVWKIRKFDKISGTNQGILHDISCRLLLFTCLNYRGGHRSPAVACWASDHWVASSNPLRGKFHH